MQRETLAFLAKFDFPGIELSLTHDETLILGFALRKPMNVHHGRGMTETHISCTVQLQLGPASQVSPKVVTWHACTPPSAPNYWGYSHGLSWWRRVSQTTK